MLYTVNQNNSFKLEKNTIIWASSCKLWVCYGNAFQLITFPVDGDCLQSKSIIRIA